MTWREDAACFGQDPDLWFPEHSRIDTLWATTVCSGCPVQAQCGAEAKRIRATDGIWAGKNRTRNRKPAEGES